jgi:hypothetical protein
MTGLVQIDPAAEVLRVARRRVTDPSALPIYHNVEHCLSGADLDDRRSGVRRMRVECKTCRSPGWEALRRVQLRDGSWTGEDVFSALGLPGLTLVSERFASMVLKHALTNAELIPAEDFAFDFHRVKLG